MDVLCRRHQAGSSRGVWSDIRHYIGRLGTWIKAVHVVSRAALHFPQHIENADIEVIEPYNLVDKPDRRHLTSLSGVVQRMLPKEEHNLIEKLSDALADIDAVADVYNRFKDNYSNVRPRPHAELLVLEHFHKNDFEFVAEDRYIGCSKPSCYCCDVYMQLHPGRFAPRPSHGNLWINWAPPIPLPFTGSRQGNGSRPQDHPTFRMMQEMLLRIRQDLQEQILSKRPRRGKLPDSTTGMSSAVDFLTFTGARVRELDLAHDWQDDSDNQDLLGTSTGSGQSVFHPGNDPSRFSSQKQSQSNTEAVALPHSEFGELLLSDVEDEDILLFKGRCG